MATVAGFSKRSRYMAIGATAVLDLLLRLPEDLIIPAFSIISGFSGSPIAVFVTTWLLLALVLYHLAPLCYSFLDVLPRHAAGFRVLVTTGGISVAMSLHYLAETASSTLLVALFGIGILNGALILWYLVEVHEWQLLTPDGRWVTVFEAIFPTYDVAAEIQSDLAREGLFGRATKVISLVALGGLLVMPQLLAGLALLVFIYAYPIPDLLFLGWVLSVRVVPEVDVGPSRNRLLDLQFDFERELLDGIEHANRSLLGLFLTLFIVVGIAISSLYLLIGIMVIRQTHQLIIKGGTVFLDTYQPTVGLLTWNWFGIVMLLFFGGSYGIWVWIRTLSRLPHFLDRWEARDTVTADVVTAQPLGFNALAVLTYPLALTMMNQLSTLSYPELLTAGSIWPLVIALGAWALYRAQRAPPQSVQRTHLWITGGLVAQLFAVGLAGNLARTVNDLTTAQPLVPRLVVPLGLPVLIGCMLGYAVLTRYEKGKAGIRRYVSSVLLLTLGGISLLSYPAIPQRYSFIVGILAIFCLGFGLLDSAFKYYAR